jgi:hypothetical protein
VDCNEGDDPGAEFPGYVCSAPAPQPDGTNGYCCATGFAGSSCASDLSVPGCVFPAVGLSCTGTDKPTDADPSLTCSAGITGPTKGDTLYCCD